MEITRHWRLKAQRYRLEGSVCPTCGQLIFPPRPICMKCQCSTQLTQTTGLEISTVAAPINTPDIESRIRYEISERMIG